MEDSKPLNTSLDANNKLSKNMVPLIRHDINLMVTVSY